MCFSYRLGLGLLQTIKINKYKNKLEFMSVWLEFSI
jgi:hypothetical protein